MTFDYIVSERTDGANPFKIFEELQNFDADRLQRFLKAMPYSSFLRTSYWFAVSMKVKSNAGMRCQVCNGSSNVQVHHRTYDTHGKEHIALRDLCCLCENCHGVFHGHKEQAPGNTPKAKPPRRKKERQPRNLHYIPSDLKMPPGTGDIVLTWDLIHSCQRNGTFTNATLAAFGLRKRDIVSGWVGRCLLGKQITREMFRQAQIGRFTYKAHLPD